jgi:hypothetical protein
MAKLVEVMHYKPEGQDSISDGVAGIFYWHSPSGRTAVLESTQTLKEMSTSNIPCWVKAAGA